MKVTLTCGKCDEGKLIFYVDPGYAPHPTMDPDHPSFSDPGSGAEVRDMEPCDNCGADPTSEDEKAALEADGDDDFNEPDEREWVD